MMSQIAALLAPLQKRIFLAIARGIIKNVDDSLGVQKIQAEFLTDEVIDRLPRVQEYGFSSQPKTGSECVALFLGGSRDNGVIIAVDDRRYRKKNLVTGEVALYTDEGDYIYFKRGGEIEIQSSSKVKIVSTLVEIESSEVRMSGDLSVLGNVTAVNVSGSGIVSGAVVTEGSTTMTSLKAAYNAHKHAETGTTTTITDTVVP